MERYYFLFVLVILYGLFALIQDLRKREVANWLNFSLIAFALVYRAFYAIVNKDMGFFLYGLFGALILFAVGLIFYYSNAFGGGDVKLLAGIGAVLPYENLLDLGLVSIEFLVILLFVGAIYTIIYSIFLAVKNRKIFVKEFNQLKVKYKKKLMIVWGISVIFGILAYYPLGFLGLWLTVFGIFISLLYVYLKALDKCMIIKLKPGMLTEGDWITEDIKIGRYVIKKTVHGLTEKDIEIIRKAGKDIYVKSGIPFVPAVFIALLIMGYVYLVLKLNLLFLLVP